MKIKSKAGAETKAKEAQTQTNLLKGDKRRLKERSGIKKERTSKENSKSWRGSQDCVDYYSGSRKLVQVGIVEKNPKRTDNV